MLSQKNSLPSAYFLAAMLITPQVLAAETSLANAPLVTSSTSSVLPNLLFVLDDSGSMDWNYMPDWANTSTDYWRKNSGYNGVYYNPAVTYSPPEYFTSTGATDSTTYPSMTGVSSSTGGNASATTDSPNWKAVKNDGYGIQSTSTTDLTSGINYYYTFVAGEYCDSPSLKNCQTTKTTTFAYPATLRWCNSATPVECQAVYNEATNYDFTNRRAPAPRTATITISGSSSTSVSSIKVNNLEILSGTATASSTSSTVASNIVTKINDCTLAISGNCTTVGYKATRSGSTITISAPGAISYTPAVTQSGSMTITPTAFSPGSFPGENLMTVITPTVDSYPYPNTSTKASTRTDCAGSTCTYNEEMTNFANWWAYYSTRMQMMKTSASIAFSTLNDNYRVGYMSINVNNGDYIPVDKFSNAQRLAWYDKFFAAKPENGTPLRVALAAAGRYFAGKKATYTSPSSSKSIDMNDDPMQYSCQQNFTILSTDGYWNESSTPRQINGSTSIGNQDSAEIRPYKDDGSSTYNKTTTQLQQSQARIEQSTSQLQKRIQQIQQRTQQVQQQTTGTTQVNGQLYTRTSSNSGSSWGDWSSTNSCTEDSSTSSRRQCSVGQLQTRTSSNGGSTWGAWTDASSCNPDNSGDNRRQCQITQNWVTVASCTPTRTGSSGSYAYTGGSSARDCQTSLVWSNVASCTAPATCQTIDSGWTNVSTCAPSGPSGGQTITCQTSDTGWVGASSCSAGSSGGLTTTCQTITTGPSYVAACTPQTAASSNNYTQTSCNTTSITPATGVSSCTAVAPSAANAYVTTSCNTATTGPSTVSTCTAESASASNNWTATTCSAATSSGGTSNTLSDVAEYYYITDLRTTGLGNCTGASVTSGASITSNDVCDNNVANGGVDAASWQHMSTFTLGLGANGVMQFSSDYAKPGYTGDYADVKNGTTANSATGTCSWQSSGACNWPPPVSGEQTTIDDLWHAGVNGRGSYFSASSPDTLITGLSNALAGVSSRVASSSAATTSNPNVSSGDNFVFSSIFTTIDSTGGAWSGDLYRQQLDTLTGNVLTSSPGDWSAANQLDTNASRIIYTFDASNATTHLKSFAWANLTATATAPAVAEQSYFSATHIAGLSQFCTVGTTCLSSTDKTSAAGENLVNFLRGDRTYEGPASDISKYYRQRAHRLGDIVNAEAVYVKRSLFNYADTGYSAFVTANESRQGMVYAGANDGMLHAFNATTGAESWAYVPSFVLPNLWILADKNYASLHRYFIDGTPSVGEVYFDGAWHTILVAGLNAGGRGYYALDITDPASPKALWEFTDTNMGYTFGNPEIGKLKDGTWVVFVTSGYNNISPGDGVGRLYVLNAKTGLPITSINSNGQISTATGDTTTPSGLSKIRAWVNNATTDNTVERVYGGDTLGNLWRFDVNNDIGTDGYDAQLLATLKDGSNNAQPLTARPELGLTNGFAMIYVGTGRFLGTPDLTDTHQQTLYAIKDNLTDTGQGNPRTSGSFVQQTLTATTCPATAPTSVCLTGESVRTGSNNTVNLSTDSGWYIDFLDAGERANTDPALALGTLALNTNVPKPDACNSGGYSYNYFLDYRTGAPVSTAGGVVSRKLGNALATRPVIIRLENNTIVQLTRLSGGSGATSGSGGGTGGGGGPAVAGPSTVTSGLPIGNPGLPTRRVSWRELPNEQ